MTTGSQRYRGHQVWETLDLKLEALKAARYDDAVLEQWRSDIIEWLAEAVKTKAAQQPALYLSALDGLSTALNSLPTDANQLRQYVSNRQPNQPQTVGGLESALRMLPLPPPKNLTDSYVELLDKEIEARTTRLNDLEQRVNETETALQGRLDELNRVGTELESLRGEIQSERQTIASVRESAEETIANEWGEALGNWRRDRQTADAERETQALEHITTLAATTKAAEALAEHAAGDLSAADWHKRSKRERRAAQWIRVAAIAAFAGAGAVGWFIVSRAIDNNFDLTVGDGILRASVAIVIGAFGALLLRESSRHFREADTAEDVALSLTALAPFYAGSDDSVRISARVDVGNAVLVRNLLSRFSHRDAAKHAGDINTAELPGLVKDATDALKGAPKADGQ